MSEGAENEPNAVGSIGVGSIAGLSITRCAGSGALCGRGDAARAAPISSRLSGRFLKQKETLAVKGTDRYLAGTPDDRLEIVARQLRRRSKPQVG